MRQIRVAFFPCTYSEVDGVANTARQFEAFARRRKLPFLTVCGGAQNEWQKDGSTCRITRARGGVGFPLDENHNFDLLFLRHFGYVAREVRRFAPDYVHITGPSDVGQLGALLADLLRIPLAASWHTNLHQYAEQRSSGFVDHLPSWLRGLVRMGIRESSLFVIMRFYQIPQMLFAPNDELRQLISRGTGKPVQLMKRGVDVGLFHPQRRQRRDSGFVIGYVGRLTVEKNIRFLAEIERALLASGWDNFRFSIVGGGAEEPWLKANLRRAEFAGVLKGENLARAYADMDAFVFPSRTDTFGNVVLEAMASGVPAVVTDQGGPQFLVRPGETGFVTAGLAGFVASIRQLAAEPQRLQAMRQAARAEACRLSWDVTFERVYAAYDYGLRNGIRARKSFRMPELSAAME